MQHHIMLFHARDLFIINVCQARELANVKLFGLNSGASKDVRRRKFPDESKSPQESLAWSGQDLFQDRDSLAFGRPGCGAPARTKSGRIRTTLIGSQDIRFQANEGVQKSIENNIRYTAHPSEKASYHAELEAQVRERKEQEALEKQTNKEVGGCGLVSSNFSTLESQIYRELGRLEGDQWGKPGPGGAYWRPSAITGQGFFDKMVGSSLFSQFGFLFILCLFIGPESNYRLLLSETNSIAAA